MKKLLLLFTILATTLSSWAASIPIDAAHFPDEEFRNYIFGNYANASNPNIKYNWAADGVLDDDEIAALTELHIDGAVHSHSYSGSITDVTGIEYFTNLEFLRIQYQPLLTLDLSHNTKLKEIYLWCQQQGQVTSLDLSQNVMLEEATIRLKTLTILNLTNCVNLRWLDCGSNQLTSFNFGNCPSLTYLYCSSNPLPSLDLSDCPSLTYLWCNSTNGLLTSVNLSQCTELDTLKLGYNIGLQTLDLTHNTKLKYVELQDNTSLQAVDFSHNTRLSYLDCSKCVSMGTLDVSGLPNIRELNCQAAGNMSVNVANCNNLNIIDLRGTTMQSIDVSQCPALEELLVAMCGLTSLDVTHNPQLINLQFYQNSIRSIDLSQNPLLQVIACWSNGLTALNLTNKPNLKNIDCYSNNITELDLSRATLLQHLNCSSNKLTSLNVTAAQNLRDLDCSFNNLTSLQVYPSISTLTKLSCNSNTLYDLSLDYVQSPTLQFSGGNQRRTGYLYTIDGKAYLHGMPSNLSRIENFKVNGVSKPLTAGPYPGFVEVGEATDNISTITFDVDTRFPNDDLKLSAIFTVTGKHRVVPITPTTFPDYSFRNVVSTQISDDPDWLSLELAESYHKLDLENKGGVFNLEGIQYFCNLDTLWCPNNGVKVFDMSSMPNLKVLNCSMNRVNPDYNAMAVVTLLETLPDNDDSWKTLYYRSERTGEYNATLTYDQCQYLKSKHWMPMEEYKVSGSTYAWREYAGIAESYNISFGNGTDVTNANYNDVFGDGTVSFNPISNVLTLNGFNPSSSTTLSCSRSNLVIKLLGDNKLSKMTLEQNVTIVGPGSLTVSSGTQFLLELKHSLHITDSAQVTIAGTPTAFLGEGIRGNSGTNATLMVDGSNVRVSIWASLTALSFIQNLSLGEGYRIVTPVHGYLDAELGRVKTPSGTDSKEAVIMYAPIYGDANDDSYINSTDLETLADILVGKAEPTIGADVNRNGYVTLSDLTTLSNKIRTPNGCIVQPVSGIELPQTMALGNGDVRTITATVLPWDAEVPAVTWSTSDNSVVAIQANGNECSLTAVGDGSCVITCSATDGSGVTATCVVTVAEPYVNLGLPSGTLWAKTNVGAETPEGVGSYFAWGETQTKLDYSSSKYFDRYYIIFNNSGGLKELTAEYDAATQQLGSNWQTPSKAQFEELFNTNYTTLEVITNEGGNDCLKVTSKIAGYTDKYIILPLTGFKNGSDTYNTQYGFYWTRNLYTSDKNAYYCYFYFYQGQVSSASVSWGLRYYGQSIRPVRKQ